MSGARILLVEDDDDIRSILRDVLEDEGYRVTEARNGLEALKTLLTLRPDLIITDLRMPLMECDEFIRAYRRGPAPHAPVILCSTGPPSVSGVETYVPRPMELDDLVGAVKRLLAPGLET